MSLKQVDTSKFAYELEKILSDYSDDVQVAVQEEAKKCANECKKAIRTDAKSFFNGSDYANGWSYRTDITRNGITCTVFNRDHYQLTHLLEFGHAKWLWGKKSEGRVDGREHIGPNADYWGDIFENRCAMALRGEL